MSIGPLGSRRLARPLAALALLVPALGWAADVATPNKGDTAWMLAATAFVLLMSVPALALFYGGLVRTKNMLSVLMQVFVGFSLISVLWCVYGYSLAFTPGNRLIGGLSRLFLAGTFDPTTGAFSTVPTFSKNTTLYELVYVGFQATFAAITGCLILGAVVERIKFSAVLLFLFIWFTFSYCPIATWCGTGLERTPTPPPTRCPHSPRRPASSGAGVRSISPAVRWCTSTPAWPAWSEPTCSASASASAASRCPRTA